MKKLKINLLIIGLTVAFFGCKEDLALKPTDTIDASTVFSSVADLESGVVGVYAGLDNPDILLSIKLSDEAYYPTENTTNIGGLAARWEIDPDLADIATNWSPNYSVIYRANRVLRVIDGIPTSGSAEVSQKARIKGELLAIRAFAHFQILKAYAESYSPTALGIPYLTDFYDDPRQAKPSRTTVADNFSKIEGDLTAAKGLIPASFTSATASRVTLKAISAIEARVFLYQKKWDSAITAATEVINSTPLATRAQFPTIWTDAGINEVVWKLKRESGNTAIGSSIRQTDGRVLFAAAPKLINTYDQTNDVRFAPYIKVDNSRTGIQTKNLIVKYVGGNTSLVNMADLKLFRTAEAYLIRAEAYAEKTQYLLAATDINTLRQQRITGYVGIPAYASLSAALTDIYAERFKELAYEGHRYFDLRRQGLTIDRNPLATDWNGGTSITLAPTAKQYFLPIPGAELRANSPNMVQNPVWKL